MKKGFFGRITSMALVLAMLIGAFTALAVTGSAGVAEVDTTPPEIVVEGPVDVWDKSTQTEPTQVDADGYVLITSAAEFMWFLNNTVEGVYTNYRLATNIDLNGGGVSRRDERDFDGIFDGDGYVISNLYHGIKGYNGAGFLFQTVTGTIKNLIMKNTTGNSAYGSGNFIENLKGGAVLDCYIHYKAQTGKGTGICYNMNPLTNEETGEVTAPRVENTIFACDNIVVTSTSGGCVSGGITGYINAGVIRNCKVYGNVKKSPPSEYGGIAAYVGGSGVIIEDCINYSNMVINGSGTTGGLVGSVAVAGTTIRNCVNYGDVTAIATCGGLIGLIGGSAGDIALEKCVNYGDVKTTGNQAGGLVGNFSPSTKKVIANCANYGSVTGAKYVGGFVGMNNGSGAGYSAGFLNFVNSANYGDVTATDSYAGGAFGELSSGYYSSGYIVKGCIIDCTVTAPTYAGGLVGNNNVSRTKTSRTGITIQDVYANVKVNATAEDGKATPLVAFSTNTMEDAVAYTFKDSKLNVTVSIGGEVVANPATVYSYNADGSAIIANYDEIPDGVMTSDKIMIDGSAFGFFNKYADTNAYMPWVQGKDAPELLICGLNLDSANLELAGNLVMNMRMDATMFPAKVKVNSVKLINDLGDYYEGNLEGDYYIFEVDDIAAKDMGNTRNYRVVVETTIGDVNASYTALNGKDYSPIIYAQNIAVNKANDEAAIEARDVLQSMVQYAYYAEVLGDGSSTILDDYLVATGIDLSYETVKYLAVTRDDVDASALNDYVTIGANLGAGVNLVLQVKDGASVTGLKLKAGGAIRTYDAVNGYIEITDVHAGMLINKLELTLLSGDAEIATGTYSVANYLNNIVTSNETSVLQKNAAAAANKYMWEVGQYQNPAYYVDGVYEEKTLDFTALHNYTFDSQVYASGSKLPVSAELNGVTWTLAGKLASSGTKIATSFNADYNAIQFGNTSTSNTSISNVTFTSGTDMENIDAISITIFALNYTSTTLEVYVGDTLVGSTAVQSATSTDQEIVTYTFLLSQPLTGPVVFRVKNANSKKPVCIRDWAIESYGIVEN